MKFLTTIRQAWNGWKKRVPTVGDLPTSGLLGEARVVLSPVSIYVWDGTQWQAISGGGGGGASFTTIQTDSGTSPVATGPTDTLTLTSSDSSIDVIGDSATDEVDLKANPTFIKSTAVADSITDGITDVAPSQNAVFDALANKAPTSRNVSAGAGLTGGGDLSADRTLALNIFGQTENTSPAGDDWAIVENNSGGTLRKVKLSNIGGQLNGIFGNGADGDATISGDGALSGNMYYNNLTVNSAVNLSVPCYKLFVKGTLTNNGRIYTSVGTSPGTATPLGKGSARGNSNSGNGNPGSANLWGIGGVGGTGGNGAGGTGGAGGSVGGSYTAASGSGKHLFDLTNAILWPPPPGQSQTTIPGGGSGGGGGAGSGSSAGGHGGNGAGSMLVVAQYLTGTGTFEAVGEDALPANGNNEGGGGGGGGGLVILVSRTALASTSLSVNVNGGLGGAGMGTGTNGTNGSPGVFVDFTGIV